MVHKVGGGLAAGFLFVTSAFVAHSTQPPRQVAEKESASLSIESSLDEILAYRTSDGLTPLVRRARSERAAEVRDIPQNDRLVASTPAQGPPVVRKTAVDGSIEIPILMVKYSNSPETDRVAASDLQRVLFDGPLTTGTMTDYYKEVSGGRFTVKGKVYEPVQLPADQQHYAGSGTCYGLCKANRSKLDEFVRSALSLHDSSVDFSRFDNDGPDGKPNSGDDDGIVDFVAIAQTQMGGECESERSIWSHFYALDAITPGQRFRTNDDAARGGKILINDYLVAPAQSCSGTPAAIGVYCHEFAHAFGLPDLYDTDASNGKWSGSGGWDLMATGSMGGDGHSHPESPSHLSAWSKEYLGWLRSIPISRSTDGIRLRSAQSHPSAIRIDLDDDRAYLIEYRRKEGFDRHLQNSGLLVWQVKNSTITSGLALNRVNSDVNDAGIVLVEADDLDELRLGMNRGDDGDVFPGSKKKTNFDINSAPATVSRGSGWKCCSL